MSLFAFMGYLLSRPFRFHACDLFQGAALLQILLTYVTAFLFFDDNGDRAGFDDDSFLGVLLVGANCMGFVVLGVGAALFVWRQSRNTNGLLRYAKGGGAVRAAHLHFNLDARKHQHAKLKTTPLEFHVFLSHAWANAQVRSSVAHISLSRSRSMPCCPCLFLAAGLTCPFTRYIHPPCRTLCV